MFVPNWLAIRYTGATAGRRAGPRPQALKAAATGWYHADT